MHNQFNTSTHFLSYSVACLAWVVLSTSGTAFDYNEESAMLGVRFAGWRGPEGLAFGREISEAAGWREHIGGLAIEAGLLRAEKMNPNSKILGFHLYKRTSCACRGNITWTPGGAHTSQTGDFHMSALHDLGTVVVPGEEGAGRLCDHIANWTTHTLLFDYGASGDKENKTPFLPDAAEDRDLPDLSITLSRLHPGVFLKGKVEAITLLAGPQGNWRIDPKDPNASHGRAYKQEHWIPRYMAVKTPDGVKVVSIEDFVHNTTAADQCHLLEGMSQGWFLMWYGESNRFLANRFPSQHASIQSSGKNAANAYYADCPFLVVCREAPMELMWGDNGGLRLEFGCAFGRMVMLPLFGEYHPKAEETENWKHGLPEEVVKACDWWAANLDFYPVRVEEKYAYDAANDAAIIENKFEYERVRDTGGGPFAPIPPMLLLAEEHGFPVAFDGAVERSSCRTAYGRFGGVANTGRVVWKIIGMGRYIDESRVAEPACEAEKNLALELRREAGKALDAGLLAPGLFAVHRSCALRTLWSNPSDTLFYMSQTVELLPELKDAILAYCREQDQAFPADTPGAILPHGFGARRERAGETVRAEEFQRSLELFEKHNKLVARGEIYTNIPGTEKGLLEFLYGLAMPQTFYNISAYLLAGGQLDLAARWPAMRENIGPWLRQSDWASLGWYCWDKNWRRMPNAIWASPARDHAFGKGGTADVNNWFGGMIGYARLARMADDNENETLGRCLFAKAAALRFGINKTAEYYYKEKIMELPIGKTWLNPGDNTWITLGDDWEEVVHEFFKPIDGGAPWRHKWSEFSDDTRVPSGMNEFGIQLADVFGEDRGYGQLVAFHNMVPELGRFLKDFLKPQCQKYFEQMVENQPDWYLTHPDPIYGHEESNVMPGNALSLFLCWAWILDARPEDLEFHLDIPCMERGDYYYMQKLAETIRQHRGCRWRQWAKNKNAPVPE